MGVESDREVAPSAGATEAFFKGLKSIAIPGGGCVLGNAENFSDLGECAFAPDFHDDDFGELFGEFLESLLKLNACLIVRGFAFKPWVECFGIGFTFIGSDIVLTAFPTVRLLEDGSVARRSTAAVESGMQRSYARLR